MRFLSIFPMAGLLIIVLLIGFKTVTLKRKGISSRAGKSKPTVTNLLLYLVFLLLLLVWLAALAGHTFNFHPSVETSLLTKKLLPLPVLNVIGAIIILLSVLLMSITLVHFKNSLRFGLNKNNQGKLITTGIFAFSRNPFFLSLDLYFIGQALIFPGILFITITIMAVIGIHLFILKEEKFLHMHYGNLYTAYIQKAGRYL